MALRETHWTQERGVLVHNFFCVSFFLGGGVWGGVGENSTVTLTTASLCGLCLASCGVDWGAGGGLHSHYCSFLGSHLKPWFPKVYIPSGCENW